MKNTSLHIQFEDHNQNFWQLASIQSAALGLPVTLVGGQLARTYGTGVAICSVFIGNLILWIIALAIIGMSGQARSNAVENVRKYLGQTGAIAASVILIIAFLGWYTLQLKAAIVVSEDFLKPNIYSKELGLRLGAALGVFIALISIGGIRLIKWVAVIGLPILISISLYLAFALEPVSLRDLTWGISYYGILSVIVIVLPGIVNLPTFFRHSRSKAHSFLAISIMTVLVSLFQCFSIWIGISDPSEFVGESFIAFSGYFNLIIAASFMLISLVCVNLVNIYLGSAGWEAIVRKMTGPKEYAIIGLAGTATFTFLQVSEPMRFLENLVNSFIASLGIVLLVSFLIGIIVRHRPRVFEKFVSNCCWFIGGVTALITLVLAPDDPNRSIIAGVGASILAFLIIIFVEETVWSIRNLVNSKVKRS